MDIIELGFQGAPLLLVSSVCERAERLSQSPEHADLLGSAHITVLNGILQQGHLHPG